MKYALAVDIGASSGRHIVGWYENGVLRTEEVYRFPNAVKEWDGHLIWDMETLLYHVRFGIDRIDRHVIAALAIFGLVVDRRALLIV